MRVRRPVDESAEGFSSFSVVGLEEAAVADEDILKHDEFCLSHFIELHTIVNMGGNNYFFLWLFLDFFAEGGVISSSKSKLNS